MTCQYCKQEIKPPPLIVYRGAEGVATYFCGRECWNGFASGIDFSESAEPLMTVGPSRNMILNVGTKVP